MFDGVVAINFILYLGPTSLNSFVSKCRRILRNGGKITLVYPDSKISFKDAINDFLKDFSSKSKPLTKIRLRSPEL